MGNLTIATIFIVTMNVLMWFISIGMININPSGSVCYNLEGSFIQKTLIQQGSYSTLNNDILSDLPGTEATITPGSSSSSFTDIFNNILLWFKSAPGIKYVYGVIAAPYNILKCMNLPFEFILGLGTLWYLVSLLVLLAFLWGRD